MQWLLFSAVITAFPSDDALPALPLWTCSFWSGLFVPTPTLPPDVMRSLSDPCVEKARVPSAGKYIPAPLDPLSAFWPEKPYAGKLGLSTSPWAMNVAVLAAEVAWTLPAGLVVPIPTFPAK